MLSTIGESPVNTLSSESAAADVAIASQILREITVSVLSEGWQFNTDINWPLVPSVGTGEVFIPANCLQIDTSGIDQGLDVAQRGSRLYDRTARSYAFTSTVMVDMVILLDFIELPQAARNYIAVRAARVFQNRTIGSETLAGFTAQDEARTRTALKRLDSNNADYNILSGSWSVARVLNR